MCDDSLDIYIPEDNNFADKQTQVKEKLVKQFETELIDKLKIEDDK